MDDINKLAVITSNTNSDILFIIDKSRIKFCSIQDCFDEYGEPYDVVGDIDCEAINYWNGFYPQSIIIGDEAYLGEYNYVDDILAEKILSEFKMIVIPDFQEGFRQVKNDEGKFLFVFSKYLSDSFNICSVIATEG